MIFSARFFSISIICIIFNAQAQPENLFTSDSSVLDNDADLDNDSQWSSNEPFSSLPDLGMNSLAQDPTTTNNIDDVSTEFLNSPFTSNPSEPLFLSSACDDQGSLTADFLQARDEPSSCPNQNPPQAGLKVPNIYDPNFLPQSLGGAAPGDSDSSNEGSPGAGGFVDEIYFGADIPQAFRLKEDLGLCPPEIFLVSNTPVCENPVTGRIEEERINTGMRITPGFVWTKMYNVIPCMFFGISCFADISL